MYVFVGRSVLLSKWDLIDKCHWSKQCESFGLRLVSRAAQSYGFDTIHPAAGLVTEIPNNIPSTRSYIPNSVHSGLRAWWVATLLVLTPELILYLLQHSSINWLLYYCYFRYITIDCIINEPVDLQKCELRQTFCFYSFWCNSRYEKLSKCDRDQEYCFV